MRRLTLRAERLTSLTTDELVTVVGGGWPQTVERCDTLLTGMYPTLPVLGCLGGLTQ